MKSGQEHQALVGATPATSSAPHKTQSLVCRAWSAKGARNASCGIWFSCTRSAQYSPMFATEERQGADRRRAHDGERNGGQTLMLMTTYSAAYTSRTRNTGITLPFSFRQHCGMQVGASQLATSTETLAGTDSTSLSGQTLSPINKWLTQVRPRTTHLTKHRMLGCECSI